MRPEDKICYCYDVSFHKLWHFARRERPSRASQMSECLGAGTGCGWCIPFLKKIHAEAFQGEGGEDRPPEAFLPLTPQEYAARRTRYIQDKEPRNQF